MFKGFGLILRFGARRSPFKQSLTYSLSYSSDAGYNLAVPDKVARRFSKSGCNICFLTEPI
jgi:hypothetical protein